LLNKFGVLEITNDEITMEPVRVAVTFDGGSVSRFLGHVTGGFKLVDRRSNTLGQRNNFLEIQVMRSYNRTFIASP